MSEYNDDKKLLESEDFFSGSGISRRDFFKYAGATAVATTSLGVIGCKDDNPTGGGGGGGGTKTTVDLGSGDIGILNTAYALEQLEAAFYGKVAANIQSGDIDFGADINNKALMAIAQHEKAHMLWFSAVLDAKASSNNPKIPSLADFLDFEGAGVDFTDTTSVLTNAHALEETGIGAYNGAGQFIKTDAYLTQAGKIVSVEARHTSIINTMLKPNNPKYFAEDRNGTGRTDFGEDANGLDQAFTVEQSVMNAAGFLNTDKLEITYDNVGK